MGPTTREEIRKWLQTGLETGATHVIIVCDLMSFEDYPVYVKEPESAHDSANAIRKRGERIMEVYSMKLDIEAQLSEQRAFHYE